MLDLVNPNIPIKDGINITIYLLLAIIICIIGIVLFKIINKKKEGVKK